MGTGSWSRSSSRSSPSTCSSGCRLERGEQLVPLSGLTLEALDAGVQRFGVSLRVCEVCSAAVSASESRKKK